MNELSNQSPKALKSLDRDIYLEVLRQTTKDFHLTGLMPNWTENDDPDVFWGTFLEMVHQLLKYEPEKLRALLYRIDLDEQLLNKLFGSNSEEEIAEFSKHILIREMQKVIKRRGL